MWYRYVYDILLCLSHKISFLYPSLTDAIKQKNVRYRMRYRKKLRYRMRYRMRYRIGTRRWQLKICDIVYDIAYDIDLDAISHAISYDLSHGISQWCDIEWIFFAISCTIFSPVPALCACSVCRCGHAPAPPAPPASLSPSRNCRLMILMPRCEDWQLLERV